MMQYSTHILRSLVGVIFLSHAIARFWHWSIPDFGAFLSASGLPFGLALAWMVTVLEALSGILLIAARFVRICVIFHALVIFSGIILVHWTNGWFVVGHGQGGIEYSILLLAVLLHLYAKHPMAVSAGDQL